MVDKFVTFDAAGGGDGTIGDPWTMAEATANVVAGDKVFVKAGTYSVDDSASSSVMDIDIVGTNANWILWEGYTTTQGDFSLGDVQPAIIDALTNTLSNALNGTTLGGSGYNGFRGLRFTGGSSHGANFGTSVDNVAFEGCKFDNNGGRGLIADNEVTGVMCEFTGNTTNSLNADNNTRFLACSFHNEPSQTVTLGSGACMLMSLFFNNGNGVNLFFDSQTPVIVGNSFDGGSQASSVGTRISGSANIMGILYNNIFIDFDVAVDFASAGTERVVSKGFNLFFGNTTDYDVLSLESNDISGTSDPFTDSANDDYSLKTGSEALDAGLDAGNL